MSVHLLHSSFPHTLHTLSLTREGLDVLEIDQLMEKVKELEGENGKLKKMLADKEKKEKEKGINVI